MTNEFELSVIMPCLNEAETIETCIKKAKKCIEENELNAEIVIADNGSTDGSIEIAQAAGARVVHIKARGYGSALIGGIEQAKGKYCIMGDADDSYDFSNLMPYVEKLREGYDLVMGNRFKGGIEKGAMPFLHKYLGTPVISFLGRLFYRNKIGDFNCGMRGFDREKIIALNLQTTGMEYASEMIVKSALNKYRIAEVPTTLKKDGRSREPYLNTWSDGWRHLKFLLLHSPNWLFLYPGIILTVLGLVINALLLTGPFSIGEVSFDIDTLFFGAIFIVMGLNAILFACYTRIYAAETEYIPADKMTQKLINITEDKGVFIGLLIFLIGFVIAVLSVVLWGKNLFSNLNPQIMMRITIPSGCMMVVGLQIMFGGFFIGILKIKHKK